MMGGISMYSDSIHTNLQNPSGLSYLNLVNFTVGGNHNRTAQKNAFESAESSSTSINYLSFAVPVGKKMGLAFGLLPLTSVGYLLESQSGDLLFTNRGSGGLNKVFISGGYQVSSNFSLGLDVSYNFGNIENTTILSQENVEFGTRETNRSDLSGLNFNFGATYKRMVSESLELISAVSYAPEANLNSENFRQFASVFILNESINVDVDVLDVEVENTKLTFPSELTIGLGIGKPRQWFAGFEYTNQKTSNFTNRSFTLENVEFKDASRYKLGGFYVPNYNTSSNYWKRATYRAGTRYEETGLIINGEAINEFGISFGVGLPVGRLFSNVNIGFEVGQRGTTNSGLVKENFFNTFISLSLNDRWFIKTFYD